MKLNINIHHTFSLLLLIIALSYLSYLIASQPGQLIETISKINIITFFYATILCIIAGIFNATLWHKINKNLDDKSQFRNSYWAWSMGRVFRYIPGKVSGYIVRHKLQSTSLKHSVVASINELLITLIPISILVLIYQIHENQPISLIVINVLAIFLLFFHKLLASYILSKLPISIRLINELYSPLTTIKKLLYLIPAMLLNGLAFFVIIKFGFEIETINFLQALLVLYLAGILGQLSLLAPGGIGVREASIVLLLSYFGLDNQLALSTAILSRLTLLFGELGNLLLAYLYKLRSNL